MFDFLKPKTHGELDGIITRLEANKSNNYKDNAQDNFRELQERYQELLAAGKLNEKQKKHYEDVIYSYGLTMKGYTHKDQTPYWT